MLHKTASRSSINRKQPMKATKLLTLGLLIGGATLATAQEGQQRPERGQRGGGRQVSPEDLKKFDKDGDGKLSQEEAQAMRQERQAEILKKYDKDGDGKLSEEEREAQRKDLEAQRKALLEKYDENKDGTLQREEIQKARAAGETIPMGVMGRGGQGGGGRGEGRGPRGGGGGGGETPTQGGGDKGEKPAGE